MGVNHYADRKVRVLGSLSVAAALVLAACGGSDSSQAESETPESVATSQNDAGEDGGDATTILDGEISCEQQYAGKTVSIFSPGRDSGDDPLVADFVGAYQPLVDCTGVEIVWEGTDQFETELNIRLEGGDAPDVIDYPQPGLLADHARQGFLKALPADIAERVTNDFIPGWDAYGTYDGVIYGIPGRSGVKSVVWYSPSAFAAAGYAVPDTFEALVQLSDQMVEDGGANPWCAGIESGVATGWVVTDWIEDFMLRLHGEEVYDQWIAHEIPFNDPRVAEAVDAVGAFLKNPDYIGSENAVKAIATTKFQDGGIPVSSGECYMHRQASFYSSLWPEGTELGADGDINFFYLPSAEGGPNYLLGAGDVYAAGTDKPESFDVVRYTGSLEYQSTILAVRGELSPRLDLDVSTIEDPVVRQLSELQLSADVFRFDASDLMPGAVGAGTFWTEATAWIVGGSTDDFVDNVEASWPN
jgi:alpha-glucoside transport system substrate-binding protein